MPPEDKLSHCGINCNDCIRHKNAFSARARDLLAVLREVDFESFAAQKRDQHEMFRRYPEFEELLETLGSMICEKSCRKGGGCRGVPCEIMRCCTKKGIQGCWECDEVKTCTKLQELRPHGDQHPDRSLLMRLREGWLKTMKRLRKPKD